MLTPKLEKPGLCTGRSLQKGLNSVQGDTPPIKNQLGPSGVYESGGPFINPRKTHTCSQVVLFSSGFALAGICALRERRVINPTAEGGGMVTLPAITDFYFLGALPNPIMSPGGLSSARTGHLERQWERRLKRK